MNKVQVPNYTVENILEKRHKYAVCIPVINEGEKIKNELDKIYINEIFKIADIIICDGGSTDGSLEKSFLKSKNASTLLVKKDKGKLSAQLRMGFDYACKVGYEGVITVDGNDKDDTSSIVDFVRLLEQGYDFIQGSRYIKGGKAINTPKIRHCAVKFLHVPIISHKAKFKYTDTTNGFRGHSRKMLQDKKMNIFRDVFDTYELLAYISVRAPRLGYKVIETPVIRKYPESGKVPTKISFLKGNMDLLKILWRIICNYYDPKEDT